MAEGQYHFIVIPFITERRAKEELAKLNYCGRILSAPKLDKLYRADANKKTIT